MSSATIFVKEKEWLKESSEEGVLDVRFDTQVLPAGCWVVAFIVSTLSGIQVLENIPHLPEPWDRRYRELRKYAITALEEEWAEEPDWLRNEIA